MVAKSAPTGRPDRVVVVPVANMFSAPNENSDVASQAIIGSNVVTLDVRRDWVRVRTDDRYVGWMSRNVLRDREKSGPYGTSGPVVRTEALFANVYQEPAVRVHKPVLTVPFESRLEVATGREERKVGWLRVRLPDQRAAWIRSGDGNRNPTPLTIPQSIELAKRFLGLPYLWGGRSSYGYDCSGFTQMLVRSRGITMPRDTRLQAEWEGAEEVDRKHVVPGDLLFFGPSPEQINHTALYIGEGEIIHSTAQNRPGVQIGRLNDPSRRRTLIACKRVT
ncbi:MAG TPA: C40 family peptidase [Thermoplasmata archaeon]|nr:C40 family peptidase [Thermoplasmata archaeon]